MPGAILGLCTKTMLWHLVGKLSSVPARCRLCILSLQLEHLLTGEGEREAVRVTSTKHIIYNLPT